jgi:hypothetical protein
MQFYLKNLIKLNYSHLNIKRHVRKSPTKPPPNDSTDSIKTRLFAAESSSGGGGGGPKHIETVHKKVDLTKSEKLSTIARMALQQDINLLKQNGGESFVNKQGEIEVKHLKFNYDPQSVLDSIGKSDKNNVIRTRIHLRPKFTENVARAVQKEKSRNDAREQKAANPSEFTALVLRGQEKTVLEEDPSRPLSKVSCSGCGARLHCQNKDTEGFMDAAKFKSLTKAELMYTVCYRCELLRTRNKILNFTTNSFDYDKFIINKLLTFPKVHVVILVDLLDMPNSLYDGWSKLIKKKQSRSSDEINVEANGTQNTNNTEREPRKFELKNELDICIVGNKFDLLPHTGN